MTMLELMLLITGVMFKTALATFVVLIPITIITIINIAFVGSEMVHDFLQMIILIFGWLVICSVICGIIALFLAVPFLLI